MTDARGYILEGIPFQRLWWVVHFCVVATGLLTAGTTVTHAQVQIDQAEAVASHLEGATQGQVVVTLPGRCVASFAEPDSAAPP